MSCWLREHGKLVVVVVSVFVIGAAVPVVFKDAGRIRERVPVERGVSPTAELEGAHYRLEAEEELIAPGETTRVRVYMDTDGEKIEAFDFAAEYDEEVVEVDTVDVTPLFASYPATEYGGGRIVIGGNIGIDESFSTDSLMAVLEVRGVSEGEARIVVDEEDATIASGGENILDDFNLVSIEVRK